MMSGRDDVDCGLLVVATTLLGLVGDMEGLGAAVDVVIVVVVLEVIGMVL